MARLSELFDMDIRRNLGREKNGATKVLQYLGPREKNSFCPLKAHNPKLSMHKTLSWKERSFGKQKLRHLFEHGL